MKENDFYYYKAKKAVQLINSDSIDEQNKELPQKLSDPDFHNNMSLYFLNITDKIRNCTEEEKRFEIRNDRTEALGNYLDILKTVMTDMKGYYNQIDLEFTDDNNGEEIGNYLESVDYINNFIKFKNRHHNDPIFKETLENMIINAHNYSETFYDYGARRVMEDLQSEIKDLRVLFPDENLSYQDANILYAQLNIYLQEMFANAEILANASLGHQSTFETIKHHSIFIEKKELIKLFKSFDKTYENERKDIDEDELEKFDKDYSHFQSTIFPYTTRLKYTPNKKVCITTREFENMFIDIMTFTYENAINFIQFLLDNKIRLTLSDNKCELYPLLLIDFDNSTIQKAFKIENTNEMIDMDTMRKILLTPQERKDIKDSLIHLEPKEQKIPIDPLFR